MRLQKGDHYVFKQGQVFCKIDYEKEVEMLQAYSQGNNLSIAFWKLHRRFLGAQPNGGLRGCDLFQEYKY